MKILILSDFFPPRAFGGAGIVALDLAKGLQKKGHSVSVIATTEDKSEVGEEEYEGIKVFVLYANFPDLLENYFSLYNPQTVKRVEKIMKEIQPDIVHAFVIHSRLSYHCLKIARRHAQAVFMNVQDVSIFHYGKLLDFYDKNNLSVINNFHYKVNAWNEFKIAQKRYNPFRNIIIRHYLKYIDRIITTSQAMRNALNDNGIDKVEIIPHGAEANDWLIEEKFVSEFKNKFNLQNKRIILFGGRLSGAKGGVKIIEAIKKISESLPEVVLLMTGKSDDQTAGLMEFAKKMGIEDKLIFTNWLYRREYKVALWASEIVVVPSICFDTFPTINLDAMACQRPVVATCFGGSPEIVQDGITGYIVNPNNVEMLAEKITDLLKNKDKAEKFGVAGLKRLKENFNLDLFIGKNLELYKRFMVIP
jgi:glycosyltransferase involved in cell wall biosynthesis